MHIHVLLGLLVAVIVGGIFGVSLTWSLMSYGVLGALIPDFEHFVYYFSYGRKTSYSKKVRHFLRRGDFIGYARFCTHNHKQLHGLYGHSLYMVAVLALLLLVTWNLSVSLAVFLTGTVSHYVFDIVEDLLLLGKINPNWLGKYHQD